MMDQRLSSGPRMPDSLNGEGALRKALDGPIDGRARKTSNTGDDGNTSSSQSLAIEGCNQVLLSLIEVRKQQGVLPLKFFGFAHSRIIPYPPSFVTINFLRALSDDYRVIVAQGTFVEAGPEHHLLSQYNGQKIQLPSDKSFWPNLIHIAWHRNKKFKGI